MQNYDNKIESDFLIYKAGVPIIERFPKEFKKNWFKAMDVRFLLILVITFIVFTGLISHLTSHQINQTSSLINNSLHEKYAHLLVPDNFSNDFMKFDKKSKETYLFGVSEHAEETQFKDKNQDEFVSFPGTIEKGSTKSLISFANEAIRNYSETSKSSSIPDVSSVGILKFITTNSRFTKNPINDILELEGGASSASFYNLKGLKVARKSSDFAFNEDQENHHKNRGAKTDKVALNDMINSLSPKDNVKLDGITKNVEFEDIPSTNLIKSVRKKCNGIARSPEEITKIIMSHNRAIQDCYKQTLKRKPKAKGKIVIRFSVAPDGTVNHVNIINSTINDYKMKQCILRKVKGWNDFGYCGTEMGDLYYRQTYVFEF